MYPSLLDISSILNLKQSSSWGWTRNSGSYSNCPERAKEHDHACGHGNNLGNDVLIKDSVIMYLFFRSRLEAIGGRVAIEWHRSITPSASVKWFFTIIHTIFSTSHNFHFQNYNSNVKSDTYVDIGSTVGVQGSAKVKTEVRFLADVIFYDRPEHRPFAVPVGVPGVAKRFAGLRKTTPTAAYQKPFTDKTL